MRALVAGGTGRLGQMVVARLVDRAVAVRVLTRDRRRAASLSRFDVEVVEGDVRRPATLRRAVDGVDVVVSAVQGFAGPSRVSPTSVDRDGNGNLVAAARSVGAAFVLVSVVGAAADSPMELFRCKHAAEQMVRGSGLAWTIVRATAFVEVWAELVGHGIVFGCGANPINFVSVADVADVVTEAAMTSTLRGQVVEVGGPEDLSLNDLAALVRAVRGVPTRVRHVPPTLLRLMALLHRQPRAALVMDTADMIYRPGESGRTGVTSATQALALTVRY